MKVVFLENKQGMTEYHGLVDFTRFGEEKDVPEEVAKKLKAKFPECFSIFDDTGAEIKKVELPQRGSLQASHTGPTVKLKFMPTENMTEYHRVVIDFKGYEEKDVPQDVGEKLLNKFPNNFFRASEKRGKKEIG